MSEDDLESLRKGMWFIFFTVIGLEVALFMFIVQNSKNYVSDC